ncbi:dimethylaniline monooxygenase (N-oxide forming) [Mycobacterium sp. BK086]|uniref:flavin-containing monooxygenase n=1 Tax=Mycobacterium sp. BK086 TaxID=2512165 RepID=UPI00105C5A80|nr:NAD(P)-binding domain-containing protein [Mycobacterium sp. BK086]TDO06525.1 dimethylaniline monooxygenase (N-oxide forming) [Mycobacterium sp. BK086]
MSSSARTVAVIGAGPGGLAAAKAAADYDLRPTVFEKAQTIGGVWRHDGLAWPGMSTNLSYPLCAFSDLPWPPGTRDFPYRDEVADYLGRYAQQFGLVKYLRLGSEVVAVRRHGQSWTVSSLGPEGPRDERFDAVIVASGVFSRPRVPQLPGRFAGSSMHSSQYQSASGLPRGPVLIVGLSFSGGEIAAEVSESGRQVTVVVGRSPWLIPRLQDGVPADLVGFTRREQQDRSGLSPEEANRRTNRYYDTLGANPGLLDRRLWIDPESTAPVFVLPGDHLPERLRAGKVRFEPGRVARLEPAALVLDTGSQLTGTTVLWCTGYHPDLSFLSKRLRLLLRYAPNNLLQPVFLYKCTFHPNIPRMAFVGLYRGPFFAVLELQARWAAAVLADELTLPVEPLMRDGLEEERQIRRARPRPQFPHDYIGLADSIAKELDVLPNLEPSDEYHTATWNGPVIAAQYRLRGPKNRREFAASQLESVYRMANRRGPSS